MIKDKKFTITVGEAISIISFIITAASFYFAIDKRLSICENEIKEVRENQKIWLKQICNFKHIWNITKGD